MIRKLLKCIHSEIPQPMVADTVIGSSSQIPARVRSQFVPDCLRGSLSEEQFEAAILQTRRSPPALWEVCHRGRAVCVHSWVLLMYCFSTKQIKKRDFGFLWLPGCRSFRAPPPLKSNNYTQGEAQTSCYRFFK